MVKRDRKNEGISDWEMMSGSGGSGGEGGMRWTTVSGCQLLSKAGVSGEVP